MEPIKPLPYGENCDYNEEEKKVWQQCLDAGLDGEEVNTVLSYTAVLQTIRGNWDEKNRVQTTKDYFKLMVDYRTKTDCYKKLHEENEDVNFFDKNWDTRIYGKDNHGHYIFVERICWYKPAALIDYFKSDDHLTNTRAVLCEAIESKKGNDKKKFNGLYKHVHILDLTGLSFGHFSSKVRGVCKNVVVEMGNFYPETIHKLMFVNASLGFRAIWSICKPWLHKITLEKTKVLGSGVKLVEELKRNDIEIGSIPDFLGGENKGERLRGWIDFCRKRGEGKEENSGT